MSKKFSRENAYALAQKKIDVEESPAGSNIVEFNNFYYDTNAKDCNFKNYFIAAELYEKAKKKSWGPQFAWCGTFVAYILHHSGTFLPSDLYYRLYYVPTAQNWMHKNKCRIDFKDAQLMDIAVFDWDHNKSEDHIGFVIKFDGEFFYTIEGNTSPDRRGSQSNGGKVCYKKRHKSVVEGVYNIIDIK